MNFLHMDSPLMQFLGKVADLLWLNVLTIICCVPIITAGASFTALNYMCIKIVRGDDVYVTKGFFKSFRENFKQSTIIWLIFLVVLLVNGFDIFLFIKGDTNLPQAFQVIIIIVAILVLNTMMVVFMIQSRFENTIKKTLKNSFIISLVQFPKTLATLLMLALMGFIGVYYFAQIFPLVAMFGISVPIYLEAMMFNKFFMKLEANIENKGPDLGSEDEHIFSDDPLLTDDQTRNN